MRTRLEVRTKEIFVLGRQAGRKEGPNERTNKGMEEWRKKKNPEGHTNHIVESGTCLPCSFGPSAPLHVSQLSHDTSRGHWGHLLPESADLSCEVCTSELLILIFLILLFLPNNLLCFSNQQFIVLDALKCHKAVSSTCSKTRQHSVCYHWLPSCPHVIHSILYRVRSFCFFKDCLSVLAILCLVSYLKWSSACPVYKESAPFTLEEEMHESNLLSKFT